MGLALSTALAFAVTVVLTLTLRPLAVRLRITQKPGGRKQHIGEIAAGRRHRNLHRHPRCDDDRCANHGPMGFEFASKDRGEGTR